MIELWDSFNNNLISRHRSAEAAVKARVNHAKRVRKANGSNSYVFYKIKGADEEDLCSAEEKLWTNKLI